MRLVHSALFLDSFNLLLVVGLHLLDIVNNSHSKAVELLHLVVKLNEGVHLYIPFALLLLYQES